MRLSDHSARDLIGRLARNDPFVLMLAAVLLGAVGGYGALGFRALASFFQLIAFGTSTPNLVEFVSHLAWWQRLAPPVLGGVIVGLINQYLLDGREPQGIAHIVECSRVRGAVVPFRGGIVSALASAISIGVGASVGREGSILHLVATISTWLGSALRLSARHAHTILGCGVAAGLAAGFNAPIAGVFFSMEVVLGHYALTSFAPVVIASVIGTMITRVHYGDFPAYVLPHYDIVTYWEFPAFILLGLVSGAVAVALMSSVFAVRDGFVKARIPVWLRPALGGLVVGVMALEFPEVVGVGYETTSAALQERLVLLLLILLPILKTVAVSFSIGSGFGGGIFSPSLYIGATMGGAFGVIAGSAFPWLAIHPGLYAIIGMAATSSAVNGAPISTILVIFELLGDFKVTIGVMSGAAVSSLLVQQWIGHSYYTWQLARRGVVLEGARAMQILGQQTVADAMIPMALSVPATLPLTDLTPLLQSLPPGQDAFVADDEDRLVGTISFDDIKDVALDPLANIDDMQAQHMTQLYAMVLPAGTRLDHAMKLMADLRLERVPVVTDLDEQKALGMLHNVAVVDAYNKALLRADAEAHGR